jgi:aminoglycoside phosphotransferase (APT) family kinase protein
MSDGDALVHGDPHPTNIVVDFRRRPTALIDFELATVGSQDWNLISLIFCWAPLEPLQLTCWRRFSDLSQDQRIAQILRLWSSPSSAAELLETGRTFIEWRKRWIARLAHFGNHGARRFLVSERFDERYAYAVNLLRCALR